MNIDLTETELNIVLAALDTVNSVGGGSSVNTLLMKLMPQAPNFNADIHLGRVMSYTDRVIQNAREAGAL